MRRIYITLYLLPVVFMSLQGFAQQVPFSQLGWQENIYLPASAGRDGGSLQVAGRQTDSLYAMFWAANVQFDKLNSTISVHQQINQTFGTSYNLRTGLSYAGYVRLPNKRSLRLGVQGIQQRNGALATDLQESAYWTNLSLAYTQAEFALGIQMENALNVADGPEKNYYLYAGFDELLTTRWLQSSMQIVGDFKAGQDLPIEWKFQYTATLFNSLMGGGSIYRNSPFYAWGVNGGIKLFRRAWFTASADFTTLDAPTDLPVHLQAGFRFRFKPTQRIRDRVAEAQEPDANDFR